MANGFHGSDAEWRRIEAPLKLLDSELDSFAHKHGLSVTKNLRDWPERSLVWGDEVRCLIQIFLVDQTALSLKLWICASKDQDGSRYWKKETLRDGVNASDLVRELTAVLEVGKRKLDYWKTHPEELQFVTKLGR